MGKKTEKYLAKKEKFDKKVDELLEAFSEFKEAYEPRQSGIALLASTFDGNTLIIKEKYPSQYRHSEEKFNEMAKRFL